MHEIVVPAVSFPPPADIRLLPIIDYNPNDMSCEYVNALYIEQQANHLNIDIACITLDQPLLLNSLRFKNHLT